VPESNAETFFDGTKKTTKINTNGIKLPVTINILLSARNCYNKQCSEDEPLLNALTIQMCMSVSLNISLIAKTNRKPTTVN